VVLKGENMKTVGELRKFLETLDDNIPIIKNSTNFEQKGAIVEGVFANVDKYSKETETFMDAFDYENYTKEVYKRDDNGIECLYIW
jgi:hypothetical protein